MSVVRLDSNSKIDIAAISFSDLCWRYGTGIDTSTGKRWYKVHSYRNGVMTKLGDIEVSVWYQLMEQLIERDHEQWLLDALIQWECEHGYGRRSPSELRKRSLKLHSMRLFDSPNWVDFVAFNKRHRPEVYARANIVTVINECCNLPGETTQEQIDRAYEDTVYCPHCGRRSKYIHIDEVIT